MYIVSAKKELNNYNVTNHKIIIHNTYRREMILGTFWIKL